jgi:predicted nucleic acid-binding protein
MKTWFVDSNIFLRFFTSDDAAQSERAAKLLRSAAEGKVRLICGPPVLFEVAWTLRSAYHIPRDNVLSALQMLFAIPGLEFTDASVVGQALTSASLTKTEFADAYIAAIATSTGCEGVATFDDKDFDRLGMARAEF